MNDILKDIENIEQLSRDMEVKINRNDNNIEIELQSIENWCKSIRRRLKRR